MTSSHHAAVRSAKPTSVLATALLVQMLRAHVRRFSRTLVPQPFPTFRLERPHDARGVHRPMILPMRVDQWPKHKSPFLMWLAAASIMIASPASQATQVELTTTVEGELQPTIKGTCNLPDGMKLVLHVIRKESAFQLEKPVEVQSGHFEVGPPLQGSGDLNAGLYHVEIRSIQPGDQPEAVRAAIGQTGQELRGPLTRRYSGATWVRLLTTFEVSGAVNSQLDEARRTQVRLSETRWWRKNCTDICSGGERYLQQTGQDFDRPACFRTCIANPPTVSR